MSERRTGNSSARARAGVCWQNKGERDIIWFPPDPLTLEYRRDAGPLVPGQLEPVQAVIDSIANHTDTDQPEAFIEYEKGLVITRREVETGRFGVAITNYIEGQAGGGESTGGSYVKVGSSTTLEAGYEHALEEGRDESGSVTTHIGAIPKGADPDGDRPDSPERHCDRQDQGAARFWICAFG